MFFVLLSDVFAHAERLLAFEDAPMDLFDFELEHFSVFAKES